MNSEGRTHAETRVYVIHDVPREQVRRIVDVFLEQLVLDGNGNARTRQPREIWEVDVFVNLSAVDAVVWHCTRFHKRRALAIWTLTSKFYRESLLTILAVAFSFLKSSGCGSLWRELHASDAVGHMVYQDRSP